MLVATGLLLTIAVALWRIARGPDPADRMMAAQLVGTSGIAIVLLLAAAGDDWAMLDVALVLALLAALSVVAFAKSVRRAGYGDPEDAPEHEPASRPPEHTDA
nr:monovalent cation/H+ antiporter complex subunit F [Wenzhouxiangella sp. XN79A]